MRNFEHINFTKALNPDGAIDIKHSAPALIREAVSLGIIQSPLVGDPEIFAEGEDSVVNKIKTESGEFVVKMVKDPVILKNEMAVLNAWREIGVKTPAIDNFHFADEALSASFMVMEFINAVTLEKKFTSQEGVDRRIWEELGGILAKMHGLRGTGFGEIVESKSFQGEFATFRQEIEEHVLGRRVSKVLENRLVSEEDIVKAERAVDVLEESLKTDFKPTVIHGDFSPDNILMSNPMTVFDPSPRISHPYLDLAKPVLRAIERIDIVGKEGFLTSYSRNGDIDTHLLDAALVLQAIKRITHLNSKGRLNKIREVRAVVEDVSI